MDDKKRTETPTLRRANEPFRRETAQQRFDFPPDSIGPKHELLTGRYALRGRRPALSLPELVASLAAAVDPAVLEDD